MDWPADLEDGQESEWQCMHSKIVEVEAIYALMQHVDVQEVEGPWWFLDRCHAS